MDFINDRLESDTGVGALREAETSISSVEDDENNFFFTKRKTLHLSCSYFWKATRKSYLYMQVGRSCASFSLN